jgi:hypothetical protein
LSETALVSHSGALVPLPPRPLPSRLPGHRYCLLTIFFCLQTLLLSSQTLGGLVQQLPLVNFVLLRLQAQALLGTPCRQTICVWLWRLGLYLLRQAPPRRNDWIWIVDHTLQWGTNRAFVVLGISAAQLAQTGFCLNQGMVHLLLVEVVSHSDGACVLRQLQTLAERVGVPVQIVNDHGGDLVKGIELFQATGPQQQQVIATYDVTHKLACLLKALLEPDPRWAQFGRQCAQTGQELRQTTGAFLSPPTPRPKARFMNLDTQVQWAVRLLRLRQQLDAERLTRLARVLEKTTAETESWLTEKLGWLTDFTQEIAVWSELLTLTQRVRHQVRQQGLERGSAQQFQQSIRPQLSTQGQVQRLAKEVETYLEEEGRKVPSGQKLLGSSEVIESTFGKFKTYLERSRWPEIGKNILLLPVLLCSWGLETVATALQTVSCQAVQEWTRKELGPSRQSKYRQVLGPDRQEASGEEPPPPKAPPPAAAHPAVTRAPPEDRQAA